MFQRQNGGWTEVSHLTKDGEAGADMFGSTVEMDDGRIAVSASGHSGGSNIGAYFVTDEFPGSLTVQYLHTDHLGSPVAATDDEGNVVGTQSFYPFGEVRSGATGIFDTERGFTGQIADAATGLNLYNARYMDPVLGRFISPDGMVPDAANPIDFNASGSTCGDSL